MESIIHHPFTIDLGIWPAIGPMSVTGFGIAMVMSFIIAQIASETEMARRGYDTAPFADITLGAVVGGLLGAKLYYAALTGNWNIFNRGGFVYWGGLLGGIIGTWIVIRSKRLPFTRISDLTAPGLAASYALGRTGCWAIGDDWGRPWSSRFAVAFPDGVPASTAATLREFGVTLPADLPANQVFSVHPTQLYEVFLGTLMFLVLWRIRDHTHAEGWLFGVFCVLAGAERFVIEFFRAKDDRLLLGGFTIAQLIAVAFVAFGLMWMSSRSRVGPGRPGIYASR